jgi:hypothetical protein
VELRGRGRVTIDPVDFVSVAVEEKEKRRSPDVELLNQGFAVLGAPIGAVEDEVIFEELLVFRLGIILLDQQLAGPSAAFLVEVEEQELVLRLGLGQGVLERSGEPGLAVGRRGRYGEGERQYKSFFHL